jgi:predicted nucleotidyltransferase
MRMAQTTRRKGQATEVHNAIAERLALRADAMLIAARSLAVVLRQRGAVEIILFGSLAAGPHACGPTSDVDMAVVMPGVGGERMHRRLCDLHEVAEFPFPLDLFVYTQEEWARARATPFVAREIIDGGVSLDR